MNNYKFRRQYSIGKYIVDFYCQKSKLAIEIDGDSHYQIGAEYKDKTRQKYLESLGIKVIRFTNTDIYTNRDNVVEIILSHLSAKPPLTLPS